MASSGKLEVSGTKLELVYAKQKGGAARQVLSQGDLSRPLATVALAQLQGLDVEFDLIGGQPKKVRPAGQAYEEPPRAAAPGRGGNRPGARGGPGPRPGRPERAEQPRPAPREAAAPERRPAARPGEFHNPYNFIPALPRDGLTGPLADGPPVGHDRYHADHFSGVIHVKLTTVTPLLLPDAAKAMEVAGTDGHKSYPLRVDAAGRPYLAPTAVKGMLRAAYEAVTNSRLAIFVGHDGRLAFRRQARIDVEPARVAFANPDRVELHILRQRWLRAPARLPSYDRQRWPEADRGRGRVGLRYPDGRLPAHGDHVWAMVEPNGRVSQVRPYSPTPPGIGWHEGWVLINNPNISTKANERVFVVSPQDERLTANGDEARRLHRLWGDLIRDYQSIHEADLLRRKRNGQRPWDYLGHEPGRTAWSRHIYDATDRQLRAGTLCYVRRGPDRRVSGLYPVAISRDLFAASPDELLPPASRLRPAAAREELSPADRVFGWVNPDGHGAYRGHLRVGPVRCKTADAVVPFDPPLPLAILGQPKPQQGRFYAAASPRGEAQPDGTGKEGAGYRAGKGLRGRKVYPHQHALPRGHWDNPLEDRTQTPVDGHFQEYRRPRLNGHEQRDDQNRSIDGWVRPGAEFTFDLHVTNLSRVELGALLYLLKEEWHHRFGGGKPLGFGSVRLTVTGVDLRDGAGWQSYYKTLADTPPQPFDVGAAVEEFKAAVAAAYGAGAPFERVPFIAAFERAARGFSDGLPVHYPRARQPGQVGPVPPHPEGKAYEWFVANDKVQRGQVAHGYALPSLVDDKGLPLLEAPGDRS